MRGMSLPEVLGQLDKPSYRIPLSIADGLLLVMTRVNFARDDARLELGDGLEGSVGFIPGPYSLDRLAEPEEQEKVREYLDRRVSEVTPVARDTMLVRALIAAESDKASAELYALNAGAPLGIPGVIQKPSVSMDELSRYYSHLGVKQLTWFMLMSLTETSVENIDHYSRHSQVPEGVDEIRDFYTLMDDTAKGAFAPLHLAMKRIGNILIPYTRSRSDNTPDRPGSMSD